MLISNPVVENVVAVLLDQVNENTGSLSNRSFCAGDYFLNLAAALDELYD